MTDTKNLMDALTGQPVSRGGVLALGNFDGVHLGHRAVATRAAQMAQSLGVPAYALTFDPHPCCLFHQDKPPFQLMSVAAKRAALIQCGLDDVITLAFTKEFAALSPASFIQDILIAGCDVRHVVVGADYAFGSCRTGNGALLRQFLEPQHIGVTEVAPLRDATGAIVSSTRIRAALQKGDAEAAKQLMGSPFTIEGFVEKGDQRGRQLGFPTANIRLGAYIRPRQGVYAILARPQGSLKTYQGVANIGVRPTIGGEKELLEAHVFDFNADIYGQVWVVELHAFIRSEQKFSSLADLTSQMQQDAATARAFFNA